VPDGRWRIGRRSPKPVKPADICQPRQFRTNPCHFVARK
jgi:hypothetical protein